MERIGDECHRYERQNYTQQHQHQHIPFQCHQHARTGPTADHSHLPAVAVQPLDTVHSLHQTIVHLRDALDAANHQIVTLKKQITVNDDIELGKQYRVQQRRASRQHRSHRSIDRDPLDNRADRGEPLDRQTAEGQAQRQPPTTATYTITTTTIQTGNDNSEPTHSSTDPRPLHDERQSLNRDRHRGHSSSARSNDPRSTPTVIATSETVSSKPSHKMASKIDVKIKLTSNFQVDGSESSTEAATDTTSESATPRDSSSEATGDRTTENNPVSDVGDDDDDDADEEDEDGAVGGVDDDSVFGNETAAATKSTNAQRPSPRRLSCENQEEVDDIELIFSSDDKELPQEDLVSISYYEPWHSIGQSGTPVLIGFGKLGSDAERTGDTDASEHEANLSPSPIDPDKFYKAIEKSVLAHEQQQLELCMGSVDSLDIGDSKRIVSDFYGRIKSLDNPTAPANDENDLRRDESFDTFEMEQPVYQQMGRRWTNFNVLHETDISKIGVIEEDGAAGGGEASGADKGRRNTCPNPAPYRPIMHREALGRPINHSTALRCPLAVKFARNTRTNLMGGSAARAAHLDSPDAIGTKRNSSAQTEISALPEHWRSESHLITGLFTDGFYTLPSKFVPARGASASKRPLKVSEKTREARRVMLSDINFTSMVPELSRSADHLCHGEEKQNIDANDNVDSYAKGPFLKTPDYMNQGITPSMSLTSPGVSQWTVNENSFGTQTTQTDNQWSIHHGDSFDSYKSYSIGSKLSIGKHNRSRSCPSVRCVLCKHRHYSGLKTSESMHYTPRVPFQEAKTAAERGSLPDLRPAHTCCCQRPTINAPRYRPICESFDSSSYLYAKDLEEDDVFLRNSLDRGISHQEQTEKLAHGKSVPRRCSENDINTKTIIPSNHNVPYLPKSWTDLKLGYLIKVINRDGRVVFGRVRYIGPMASESTSMPEDVIFVGVEALEKSKGYSDGSFEGRRFFDCAPDRGIFVPFKKVVMAWNQ